MAAIRRAEVTWEGDLMSGKGVVSATSSGIFKSSPVSWAARTEASDGKTSPEELLAAAHASCFSMAFSARLAKNGTPGEKLEVSAAVTFEKVEAGFKVTKSELTVRGWVKGLDQEAFARIADDAKDNCPISAALKGNVALSVDAKLAD